MTIEPGKLVTDTSFDEALDDFKEFLSGQGLPTELVWVFREDVICQRERVIIKTPVPAENEALAKACYELGQQRNFGINLHAFCLLESRPCCYIVLPEDGIDAEHMLIPKVAVKYSVLSNLTKAEPVLNPVKWHTLRLLNRKSAVDGFNEYIPSKYTLLPEYRVADAG
ncbi:MAG: hypothetical protein ACKVQW_06600 [Pyrinomonadaceae bacterium]